jgi:hypothetical protein
MSAKRGRSREDAIRLAKMEEALKFLATYEKDPPDLMYDEWAHRRLLDFIHKIAEEALKP